MKQIKITSLPTDPILKPLGLTVKKQNQGVCVIAEFASDRYPACNFHGAMNKVAKDAQMWRCLICNIGCELSFY